MGSGVSGGLLAIAPLALGMVVIGLVGNFAQTGFAISGKALRPKFERISPGEGPQAAVLAPLRLGGGQGGAQAGPC